MWLKSVGLAASCVAAGAWLLPQTSSAEVSGNFTYRKAQLAFLSLSPAQFTPERNDFTFQNTGGFLHTRNPGTMCFHAQIQLPQGSHLTGADVFYSLVDTGSMTFKVLSVDLGSLAETTIVESVPETNTGTHGVWPNPVGGDGLAIDNYGYTYFARVCMSETNAILYDVHLWFTYTSAGY